MSHDKNSDLEIARRHSASHIMTAAVRMIHPGIKMGVGPWTDDGFYQDFDFGMESISDSEFKDIEKKMRWIVNKNFKIVRSTHSLEEARKEFGNDPYKMELIQGIADRGEELSFYDFVDDAGKVVYRDLCAGPHLKSTGELGAFKLMKLAGSYWRGDSSKPMLTRIYGVAFPTKEALEAYENFLLEAAKRDHRKIGQELDLFSFHEEGPGFPFWHPNGMILMNKLIDFWRAEHTRAGYQEIKTPIMLNEDLWHKSGHWDHYKENMYFTEIDEKGFAVKPMNCPGGMLVYKTQIRSYRDLPLRMGELGLVHRHELSGVLHGLFRVRAFTQDDAHIFCTPSQVESELAGVIALAKKFYETFGFSFHVELSTRPEKSIGSDEIWNLAETTLEKVIKKSGITYNINPGDGAFYGPKLDFHLRDAIGRTWQCGTVQLDFAMPERFDLHYIDEKGERKRPVMLHRVVFGSIERFIGILTEHTAGAFPMWCAPMQASILPVGEKHLEMAGEILGEIKLLGGRAEILDPSETLAKRVRNSQTQKVPVAIIIGDDEVQTRKLTVRKYGEKHDVKMSLEELLSLLQKK